ncbi:MAG: glycosyltransferase family 2 protein [Candidatus Coproplasma sp.]
MGYLQIVNVVFNVLSVILSLMVLHFAIFFIVGAFKKKKFPKAEKQLKYGIIIPARNEELVVGNLIKSVYLNKYPQDKLQVFVIAHNCTDNTAEIARRLGATVYEYNNPEERTMGYAFRYLFDRIREDFGVENYDGFFLFNADNVLDECYFEKMNDAFVANDCKSVVTSFRNSKNFGQNLISALYGIYFMQGCRYEARGRTVVGCSTRVQGTGYVISSEIVKDGWPYVTLTEDWEFSADQILGGNKIVYCDEAVFYDEQPTDVKIMLRQRLRWAKGHLLVCLTRLKDLIKGIFLPKSKGGAKHKMSTYDISVNVLPICTIGAVLFALQLICISLAPLFGYDAAIIWSEWAINLARSAATYYASTFLTGVLLVFLERKRIPKVKPALMVASLLVWPLFLFLSVPIELVCLFKRNLDWKTIPHKNTTTFEQVNNISES